MSRTARAGIAVVASFVFVALAVSPGLAFHGGSHFGDCPDVVTTDCIVLFRTGTVAGSTMSGSAPPAGVSLDVWSQDGVLQIQVNNANGVNSDGDPDMYELSPALTPTTQFIIRLRLGASFSPAVIFGQANVIAWYWDATVRELTIVAEPRSSSWVDPMCVPDNCPSPASRDYTAMALLAADDTVIETAPPEAAADITMFLTKYTGGFMATNGQYGGLPYLNPLTNAVEFDLGAPSLKSDGVTVNTGYFRVLVPDLVITDLWQLDPATLSAANVSVTMDGTPTNVTMTRVESCADLGILVGCPAGSDWAGWLFENLAVTFSTPTVSIAPVSSNSVVVDEPPAPVSVPESAPEAGGSLDLGSIVRLGSSGKVGVPVTLSGVGAQLGIAAGTSLSTSAGTFAGDIIPPFSITDPTGGKLSSVTALIASGLPVGQTEVVLSQPATLTLPVPAGGAASRYQPVEVDRTGKVKYLTGESAANGVALKVDRLGSATAPWQRAYGLAEVPAPPVLAATPSVPTQMGPHSSWAGQSGPVDLAAGQLADVTVRLLNAGDQPWMRGTLGKQLNLGSNAAGSTADVDSGLIVPLWGRDRFATTNESIVNPGEYGTLTLRVRAPTKPGIYRIYTRPVIDGVSWLEDQGIYVEVTVR